MLILNVYVSQFQRLGSQVLMHFKHLQCFRSSS